MFIARNKNKNYLLFSVLFSPAFRIPAIRVVFVEDAILFVELPPPPLTLNRFF